jgi:ParB family chromosome partitioning protein
MLPITSIQPNPLNPRAELGDLSELTASIAQMGVLQNLVVVGAQEDGGPDGIGTYLVVAGHRRFAAAKMAGLTEVPCVCRELAAEDQIAIMLAENIARQSLTPLEEAHGIQMMMDLGLDDVRIASTTGLSETTVRRRKALLRLPQKAAAEKVAQGATLKDLVAIAAIEDEDARDGVLSNLGTSNFDWSLKSALKAQEAVRNLDRAFCELEAWGCKRQKKYITNYYPVSCYLTLIDEGSYDKKSILKRAAPNGDKHKIPPGGEWKCAYDKATCQMHVWYEESEIKQPESPEQAERRAKDAQKRKKLAVLNAAAKQAKDLRTAFEEAYEARHDDRIAIAMLIASAFSEASEMAWDNARPAGMRLYDAWKACEGIDDPELTLSDAAEERAIAAQVWPLTSVAQAALSWLERGNERFFDSDGHCKPNTAIHALYEFLEAVGYRVSDEERGLLDGTSRLYGDNVKDKSDEQA